MNVELSWDEFRDLLQARVTNFSAVLTNAKAGNVFESLRRVKSAVDSVISAKSKRKKR